MKSFTFLSTIVLLFITNSIIAQTDYSWLDNVKEDYKQPAWFNSQRVQIHTRLAGVFYRHPDHEIYSHWAEKAVIPVGAKVLTRHIKSDDKLVHWQSAWGESTELAKTRNIIKEAVDEAHANGTKMIGYYNHYTDGYLRDHYPEYICKDVKGESVVKKGRGTQLCFNSPAIDSIAIRLVEFAEMGGDGLYFDEIHMPRAGCWCNNCKTKFKKQTGKDAPETIDVNSQLYKDYQNFNNQSVLEGFIKWKKKLEAANPEFVMIVGSNTVPKLTDRHLNTNLLRIAHSHKTEPNLPMKSIRRLPEGIVYPNRKVWRGLSYTFSRDISDGRPAHYWMPGLYQLTAKQIRAFTAGIISFGNIANLDMKENLAPDMKFVPAVKYGNRVSPTMAETSPLNWLLVHFNEEALEKNLGSSYEGWSKVLSPFYGAFNAAHEEHIPVGIITDSQLYQGLFRGAKVLFLPNTESLSDDLKAKIKEFEANGGTVISQKDKWQWHLGGEDFDEANKSLKNILNKVKERPLFEATSKKDDFYYSSYFIKEDTKTVKYIASFSNSIEWVEENHNKKKKGKEPIEKPEPVSCVTLKLRQDKKPLSVKDIASNKEISYKLSKGVLTIDVPEFEYASLIEITYEK